MVAETILKTWSGMTNLAHENQIVEIKDMNGVSLLQNIVASCKGSIRVVGSALSYEALASVIENHGTLVSFQAKGMAEYDDETVTFFAGTTLDEIFKTLETMNREVSCSPGVIGIQTLAGAISTGTHGQGIFQSSISDIVTSMKVMLPSGEIRIINRKDENFGAFILSVGCLGIILSVQLQTRPLRVIKCTKLTIGYDDFKNNFVNSNKANEFCKGWWFPETDDVHVWKSNEASPEEASYYFQERQKEKRSNVKEKKEIHLPNAIKDSALADTIKEYESLMACDTKDDAKGGRQFETIHRFVNKYSIILGTINEIFCKGKYECEYLQVSGIPVPQINCEIGIPMENFEKALEVLKDWSKNYPFTLHYPFIFRFVGPSEAWLSPAYHRYTCYIGILVYIGENGIPKEGSFAMMKSFQKVMASIGGIPHFGKHFSNDVFDFNVLPNFGKFKTLIKHLDPTSKFQNEFLNKIFE